jgi:hypothetical protein
MKNSKVKIPKNIIDAIDCLVGSGDDEGCEGLVVVDRQCFLDLVEVCHKLGVDCISTHIEDEDDDDDDDDDTN